VPSDPEAEDRESVVGSTQAFTTIIKYAFVRVFPSKATVILKKPSSDWRVSKLTGVVTLEVADTNLHTGGSEYWSFDAGKEAAASSGTLLSD